MARSRRTVVAVSDDALRAKLLDAFLGDTIPHDVIFVECLADAYRRIRRMTPDLIVVLMRIDDEEACRLLTMLNVDREFCGIPLVMLATGESEAGASRAIGGPVSAESIAWARA